MNGWQSIILKYYVFENENLERPFFVSLEKETLVAYPYASSFFDCGDNNYFCGFLAPCPNCVPAFLTGRLNNEKHLGKMENNFKEDR
jgi:hypothetical protein